MGAGHCEEILACIGHSGLAWMCHICVDPRPWNIDILMPYTCTHPHNRLGTTSTRTLALSSMYCRRHECCIRLIWLGVGERRDPRRVVARDHLCSGRLLVGDIHVCDPFGSSGRLLGTRMDGNRATFWTRSFVHVGAEDTGGRQRTGRGCRRWRIESTCPRISDNSWKFVRLLL